MNVKVLNVSVTTCYLIGTGNKYVLIDMGFARDWKLFCEQLQNANVSFSDISHLVLTHHHNDHCGSVNSLLQANKDIRVVMSRRAKALLAKGHNARIRGTGAVNKRVILFGALLRIFNEQVRTHAFPPYTSRECDILVDGARNLDQIGIELGGRIMETPGHTADSISVLLDDENCFVGDAASNFPGFLGTQNCVPLVEDIDEYYRSWSKLVCGGARNIFPAHGKPFPATRLSENIGKIKRSNIIPLV